VNRLVCARLLLGLVAITAPCTAADDDPFEFAIIGDNPYTPTAITTVGKIQTYPSPAYENLITHINAAQKVQFTVHAGDIKAGDTLCSDNVYTTNRDLFNSFARPVIFAPGDNEWTDCHRANNGGMNPIERLAFLRAVFYTNALSLGGSKMPLNRQSADPEMGMYLPYCPTMQPGSIGCSFAENVMWTFGPADAAYRILFVTLNQPGSNNNHSRSSGLYAADTEPEYSARNAANIAWLNKAFNLLYADGSIKGLVVLSQANAFERYLESGQGYTSSGYADFITTLRNRAKNQQKRILVVGGDTHYFRIDKPLTQQYPECLVSTTPCRADQAGPRLLNVTRTEVFAQMDAHWTKVKVEPKNPELFVVEPQTVPANAPLIP
jgi:hypothetical protein